METIYYRQKEVIAIVTERVGGELELKETFLDYLVARGKVEPHRDGPGRRRKYTESDVDIVASYWEESQQGSSPSGLSEVGSDSENRAYLAFQVTTPDAPRLIDRLRANERIVSLTGSWGALDLLVELKLSGIRDLVNLRSDIMREFPEVEVWPEIDFLLSQGSSSLGTSWKNYPKSIHARILVRLNSGVNKAATAGLLQDRFDVGIEDIVVEAVEGTWDIVVSLEAFSVLQLSTFVSTIKKDDETVARTATFITVPRFYYPVDVARPRADPNHGSESTINTSMRAYVFAKAFPGDRGRTAAEVETYQGVDKAVNVWGGVDVVCEMRARSQSELADIVFDKIGRTRLWRDTGTHVVNPVAEAADLDVVARGNSGHLPPIVLSKLHY